MKHGIQMLRRIIFVIVAVVFSICIFAVSSKADNGESGITTPDGSTLYAGEKPTLDRNTQSAVNARYSFLVYRIIGEKEQPNYQKDLPSTEFLPCDVRAVVVPKEDWIPYYVNKCPADVTKQFDELPGVTLHYINYPAGGITTENGSILGPDEVPELVPGVQQSVDNGNSYLVYRVLGQDGWVKYKEVPPTRSEMPCDVRITVISRDELETYMDSNDFADTMRIEELDGIYAHYDSSPYSISDSEAKEIKERLTVSDYTGIAMENGAELCIEKAPELDEATQKKIELSELYLLYRVLGEEEDLEYSTANPGAGEAPCDTRVIVVTRDELETYLTTNNKDLYTLEFERKPATIIRYVDPVVESFIDENYNLRSKCVLCNIVSDSMVSLNVSEGEQVCLHKSIHYSISQYTATTVFPKIVYMKGRTYSLDAPTEASSAGTKYTLGLTTSQLWEQYQKGEKTINQVVGNKKTVIYKDHWWVQTYGDYSFDAECTYCRKNVSVRLDTTALYDASRRGETTGLNYSYFVDTGWYNEPLLPKYHIIYDGLMTEDDGSTTKLVNVYAQPSKPGNFSAKIVLTNRRGKITTETKTKEYYIADFPFSSCEVVSYGPRQIELFSEPQSTTDENGAKHYTVSTKSELLWCSYHVPENQTMYITLTNDIVLNPITVSDNGEIRSALLQIYRFAGFGTNDSPASVVIDGGGFTIYGLYADDQIHSAGLVACGLNSSIKDLTIENSYIYGLQAGAFFGNHAITSSYQGTLLENCVSRNNYIKGEAFAGGFIGCLRNASDTNSSAEGKLVLKNLINRSGVTANHAAGIVGSVENATSLEFFKCFNVAKITANSNAGGIVAILEGLESQEYQFNECLNSADVDGTLAAGGILGFLNEIYQGGPFAIKYNHCVSYGTIGKGYTTGSTFGAMIGKITPSSKYDVTKFFTFTNCERRDSTWGPSEFSAAICEPSKSDYACSHFGHIESSTFSDVKFASCTESGQYSMHCLCCNSVMYDSYQPAHGHVYDYNEDAEKVCVYCGQAEPKEEPEEDEELEGTASIFSSYYIIGGIAFVVLIVAAVVWIIIKKKKKQNN